jgi:N-acetylmuramoyl-L-alanine amidase
MMHLHQHPSPNHRERREGEHLQYVILHGTYMANDAAVLSRLTDPATQLSCHYFIDHDARIHQLVDESRVAYHAGKSVWNGIENLNGYSLGIEIGNAGPFPTPPTPEQEANPDWSNAQPYLPEQYNALISLLRDIMARHPHIKPKHVLAHSEISPGRKSDPGPLFDWNILATAGVALRRPL